MGLGEREWRADLVHIRAHVGRQLPQRCDTAFYLLPHCQGGGWVEWRGVNTKGWRGGGCQFCAGTEMDETARDVLAWT